MQSSHPLLLLLHRKIYSITYKNEIVHVKLNNTSTHSFSLHQDESILYIFNMRRTVFETEVKIT